MGAEWQKDQQLKGMKGSAKCIVEKAQALLDALEAGDMHQILKKHDAIRFHYATLETELKSYLGVKDEA